ncbi:MAG TPA: SCO family protein [Metalysinibacillus jejuensis]|uniref:SCO family protein n=1 Tax=Metalysinibacillus jejuensis TaxID=914327 RepID=A0A921T4B8_9BACL|nr:SCO family protein [Metalysinibacillus jejuensis]HJH10805.1 SCO family protein [Metalysinibacillus jejuensis]
MKKKVGLVIALMLTLVLSACSNYKFKEDMNVELADFNHMSHRGEKVSLDDLKGKPWLGMYIFTNCNTVCFPMTENMKEVQERLIQKGIEDYNIVAFSVDPANDTEEALTNYLARYEVPDDSKWHLLTGYDQKYIEQYAFKSTKQLVRDDPNSDQVTHSVTFFLVDETGKMVKNYSGYSEEVDGVPIDLIVEDMGMLIDERIKNKN